VVGTERGDELAYEKIYNTCDFHTFEQCFTLFCEECSLDHFDASCLAVAGPVKDNVCKMTNLDWVIDGRAISKGYNIADVAVINDFVAIGYGIASIEPSERISINNIVPEARGPIAIIGPGTGLGVIKFQMT